MAFAHKPKNCPDSGREDTYQGAGSVTGSVKTDPFVSAAQEQSLKLPWYWGRQAQARYSRTRLPFDTSLEARHR